MAGAAGALLVKGDQIHKVLIRRNEERISYGSDFVQYHHLAAKHWARWIGHASFWCASQQYLTDLHLEQTLKFFLPHSIGGPSFFTRTSQLDQCVAELFYSASRIGSFFEKMLMMPMSRKRRRGTSPASLLAVKARPRASSRQRGA